MSKLLEILRNISEIIANKAECNPVLTRVVELLANRLKVDVCSVYIFRETEGKLVLAATHGLNIEAVGKVQMEPGEGLTGTSFKEREVFNLSHPEQHPSFKYFENTGEERFKSFLAVPLSISGRCMGVLTMQRVKSEKFSLPVVDMARSLSTQLANLILNASMLEDLASRSAAKETETTLTEESKADKLQAHLILRGSTANSGLAHGRILIYESKDRFEEIVKDYQQDSARELALFDQAVEMAKQKTVELEQRALSMISEADASIFNAHLLFLDDKTLLAAIRDEISAHGYTIEFAIKLAYKEYERRFTQLNSAVFRDKIMDLKDVMLRMIESSQTLRRGGGERENIKSSLEPQIVVGEEILPSDLIRMPVGNVAGLVCVKGGATAHVAILAKALNIPALIGVRGYSPKQIHDGDEALLDCHAEVLYVRPTQELLRRFKPTLTVVPDKITDEAPPPGSVCSSEGKHVTIRANISLICETAMLKQYGAEGIGLYRTEFLFMVRDYLPLEDDQYRIFSKIIKSAAPHEVTIRILDIGGDKPLPYMQLPKEDNPSMGRRGIRFLLERPDIFKPHLRAILRAGEHGRLKILFPMISSSREMLEVRKLLKEAQSELLAEKLPHSESFKTGIMLEIPSALFDLDALMKETDYMSIGSNDLFQYCFAVDRGNEALSEYAQMLNPVFLRILKQIGDAFAQHPEKGLAICGEMAGNPRATPFLIGAGIRDLSMAPRLISQVRKTVQNFSTEECKKLVEEAVKFQTSAEVTKLLKKAFSSKNLAYPG
ncbi:MAG: phosphoenolpyruvate--protein phosphotransferase [Lentisphaerae bacterium GWF2_52_8]|nr:MAG: phosphoenolpyruvate--protein phosphotransferase [Lentisphaerae bacterium GWF2_52_8]